MATATHAGPIGIEQINTTFYVTGRVDGFSTIQQAVDFVRVYNGSTGLVIVCQGVNVADEISAVTGGDANILIWDNRAGNDQHWYWNGTNYVPQDCTQLSGFVAFGVPNTYPASTTLNFDPGGTGGAGTGNIIVTATPGKGMPSFNLLCSPQDGTHVRTFFRADLDLAGNPRVQMPAALEVYSDSNFPNKFNLWVGGNPDFNISKGMYVWAKASANAIDFQGMTEPGNYDQTIRLNHLGGNVEVGQILTANETVAVIAGPLQIYNPIAANFNVWIGETFGGDGVKGMTIHANAAQNAVDFQAQQIDVALNQTIRLNPAGGPVQLGPLVNIVDDGTITATNLSADSAAFDICLVDNSPVRTFANSPDTGTPGGMEWPPAGIAVSTGTAWDDNSIDPATVPRLNAANTFTADQTINGKLLAASGKLRLGDRASGPWTGTANINSDGSVLAINAGTNADMYLQWDDGNGRVNIGGGPGIGGHLLLDGTTGSISMDGLLTVVTNAAIGGTLQVNAVSTLGNLQIGESGGALGGQPSIRTTSIGHVVINPSGGNPLMLNWEGGGTGTFFGDGATHSIASIDNAGTADFSGCVNVNGNGPSHDSSARVLWQSDVTYFDSYGSGGVRGSFNFRQASNGAFLNGQTALTIDDSGNAAFFGSIRIGPAGLTLLSQGGSCTIDSGGQQYLFLSPNWGGGRGIVQANADFTVNGNFTVTGGGKGFLVPHPLDETKDLHHACLEGPEHGVFYRGEAQVVDGYAVVTLPDYFEALTFEEDRSVQLTQIYDGTPLFARLAASRVVDGQFTIHSPDDVTVAWEVKAVRRLNPEYGPERLQVAQAKRVPPEGEPTQEKAA